MRWNSVFVDKVRRFSLGIEEGEGSDPSAVSRQ
jgi:hypothetical protein